MRDDWRRGHFRGVTVHVKGALSNHSYPSLTFWTKYAYVAAKRLKVRANGLEGEQVRERLSASELYKARGY